MAEDAVTPVQGEPPVAAGRASAPAPAPAPASSAPRAVFQKRKVRRPPAVSSQTVATDTPSAAAPTVPVTPAAAPIKRAHGAVIAADAGASADSQANNDHTTPNAGSAATAAAAAPFAPPVAVFKKARRPMLRGGASRALPAGRPSGPEARGDDAADHSDIAADGTVPDDSIDSRFHVAFTASGTAANAASDSATRTLDVDAMDPARAAAAAAAGDAVYTIPKAAEYINKAPERVTQRTAGGIRAGPLANPSGGHVRIISRMDYAPDVCKDFKETGFCGYGDSCIFMHDRSGMKHGPQVERIWETVQQKHMAAQRRGAAAATSASAAAADVATDRPFACHICRKPFTSPVMTKCGHYFCETCILGCYRKSKACPVCSAGLDGVFRPARDLPPPPVASS